MQIKKEIKNYLDKDNRIKSWPSKEKFKMLILEYLASQFTLGVNYTEKEVNDILSENHAFNDNCFLRRELFDKGFLDRTLDCRQYWKTAPDLIEGQAETERLIIKDADLDECESLQKLYESGKYLKDVMGDEFEGDHIYQCLTKGDLPPIDNAKKEYYKFKSIYNKDTSELVGFVDIYHGYPEEKTVWISLMLIHPAQQRNGYGREVIEYLCREAERLSFEKVALAVSLKNWSAIRFLSKSKFDKIIGIYGAKEFSADKLALMGLERVLE